MGKKLVTYVALSCSEYADGHSVVRVVRLDPATRQTVAENVRTFTREEDGLLSPMAMMHQGLADLANEEIIATDGVF